MSRGQFNHVGFTDPGRRHQRRRSAALAELVATVALVISIAVAATAVSIGFATARTPALPLASMTMPATQ